MFRQSDLPKRNPLDSRKHFPGTAEQSRQTYPHRLNFYRTPPTAEITLEQFEQWALDRLAVLCEIESCQYRNKTPEELNYDVGQKAKKHHLILAANSSVGAVPSRWETLQLERQKDHYSHFILRLAFAQSAELRRRFRSAEVRLFKLRWEIDGPSERDAFVESLGLDWDMVSNEEKNELREDLAAGTVGVSNFDAEGFLKVSWDRVHDLVEQRKVLVRGGKAYVPVSQQLSLVVAEYAAHLEKGLEATARALPRLDEDDRLLPILNFLTREFNTPSSTASAHPVTGAILTASSIDSLTPHFPLCMRHLHTTLRGRDKHLKHFGRLQYGLFIKGIGLSVDEALAFWRSSLTTVTEDEFNKEHRYNIRHSYGLEGTRRNYKPMSCQQILTERIPGYGEAHGCPYRHFSLDNLLATLRNAAIVADRDVLRGVQEDVEAKKYHIACTRVFEHVHAKELKREKDAGTFSARMTDPIIHPNEYFSRSFALKNPNPTAVGLDGTTALSTAPPVQDAEGDEPMI